MSHRLSIAALLALCAAPNRPAPGPAAPPDFVVTRADVERILADARDRAESVIDPLGVEHPMLCWQHDCLAAARASARHGCRQEGQDPPAPAEPAKPDDPAKPADPAGGAGDAPGADPSNPPPPEPTKPFDPKKYEYPFPTDAGEGVIDLLRKADAKRKEAERKPPQLDLYEEANALYEAATKTGPGVAYAWYHIARNCQDILEFKLAREAIDKALKLDPKSAHLLTEDGDIHNWMGDRDKALVSYEKALANDPRFVPAYTSRASVRQQQHEWALAKADVLRAIEIEPTAEGFKGMLEQLEIEIANMGFTGKDTVVKDTSHYRIYCHDKGLANLVGAHAEAIYDYYTERFPKASLGSVKFSIYLFSDMKSYFAAGAPRSSAGYYSPGVRKLVLPVNFLDQQRKNPWKPGQAPDDERLRNTLLVLYHEGFHQFLHYSLQRAPQWFNEGHGDYYGGARWDPKKKRANGGIGYFNIGLMDWRTRTIQQVNMFGGAGRYEKPQRLMQMTQAEMYSNAGLMYAQSWSMVHFLHSRDDIGEKFLVPYYKELRKGKGLRTAFDATFGRTDMNKFEEMWVDFAKAKHR
jgi:tetratricopeptide (TPR) repeat protein